MICYENYLIDAMLDKRTDEQITRRKANRKHKLAVDAIKGWLVCGNVKRAIDIAQAYGICEKEFGKICGTV